MHGIFNQQIVEVADVNKSYKRLERVRLKERKEALIVAAQEQTLSA